MSVFVLPVTKSAHYCILLYMLSLIVIAALLCVLLVKTQCQLTRVTVLHKLCSSIFVFNATKLDTFRVDVDVLINKANGTSLCHCVNRVFVEREGPFK